MPFLISLFLAALLFLPVTAPAAEDKGAPATPPAADIKADTKKDAEVPPVVPAEKEDLKAPDTSNIMFLQNLRRIGATIYYMGEAMGLHGWLVVKDDQLQIIYTTPDQRGVMIGALLSAEGANISQQQILLLANTRPEISELLRKGQGATVQVADEKQAEKSDATATVKKDAPPSEQIYAELEKATMVSFGKPDAPLIYMLMDVNCSYCHATWKKLEKYVDSGALRLSMIPVAALGAQSLVEAANWLNKKDPRDAWKKHVDGDALILKTGTPDAEKEKAVAANFQIVQKWNIQKTPYLFYRGKNGKVRLIVGEPQDVDALMNDLGK